MAEPNKAVFTYVDQAGKTATSEFYFTTGLTLAQITEGLGAGLAAIVDAVTGAIISGVNALIPVDISALTGNTTGVTGDVFEVGEFISQTAAGRKIVLNVPAIVNTLSTPGTDDIDQTDTDVAALISALEDGIATAGGTMLPVDAGGDDLVQVLTARERVRNSGARS